MTVSCKRPFKHNLDTLGCSIYHFLQMDIQTLKADTVPVLCQLPGSAVWHPSALRLLHIFCVSKADQCQQLEPIQTEMPRPTTWLINVLRLLPNRYDSHAWLAMLFLASVRFSPQRTLIKTIVWRIVRVFKPLSRTTSVHSLHHDTRFSKLPINKFWWMREQIFSNSTHAHISLCYMNLAVNTFSWVIS